MSFFVTRLWIPVPVDLADVDRVLLRDLAHERRGAAADPLLDRLDLAAARRSGGRRSGSRRPERGRRRRGRPGAGRGGGRPARRPGGAGGGPPARLRRARGAGARRGRRSRRGAGAAAARPSRRPRRSSPTTVLIATVCALLDLDLEQRPRDRRRDLGVHLVGRDLEDRLVPLDRVADLLEPLGDGSLGDRLAHLRHDDRVDMALVSFVLLEPVPYAARARAVDARSRRGRSLDPRPPRTEEYHPFAGAEGAVRRIAGTVRARPRVEWSRRRR